MTPYYQTIEPKDLVKLDGVQMAVYIVNWNDYDKLYKRITSYISKANKKAIYTQGYCITEGRALKMLKVTMFSDKPEEQNNGN